MDEVEQLSALQLVSQLMLVAKLMLPLSYLPYRTKSMTVKKRAATPTIDPKLEKQLFKNKPASGYQLPDDTFYDEIITENQSHCNHIIFTPPDIPKTLLATGIISKAVKKGRVWYVASSPHLSLYRLLKIKSALSHISLAEMTEYSRDYTDHQIVVWTVKLLHDYLADIGNLAAPALIIFDNAEFLAHPQASPFLENCLTCLNPDIPVILLASLCKNQTELQNWLAASRERPCKVIKPKLTVRKKIATFISAKWYMTALTDRKRLAGKAKRIIKEDAPFENIGSVQFIRQLTAFLRDVQLVPALVVMPSAKACDKAMQFCIHKNQKPGDMLTQPQIAAVLNRHPFLKEDPMLSLALTRRAAPFHSGLRPFTRKLIEHLLSFGALDIIFCTSDSLEEMTSGARIIVLCLHSESLRNAAFWKNRISELATPISAWQIDHIKLLLERYEDSQPGCMSLVHGTDTDWVAVKDLFLERQHVLKSALNCNFQSALAMAANKRDPDVLLQSTLFAKQNPCFGDFCLNALKAELGDFLPQARCSAHLHSVIALTDLRLALTVKLHKINNEPLQTGANHPSLKREEIESIITLMPCETCEHFTLCHKKRIRKFRTLIEEYYAIQTQLKTGTSALKLKYAYYFDSMKAFGWIGAAGPTPTKSLTHQGVIALRSGLSFPQSLSACLKHRAFWPNHKDYYTAIIAGFAECVQFGDSHVEKSLADELNAITVYYERFEPLLHQAQKMALNYGIVLPRYQPCQAALMLAYRQGQDIESLTSKTGIYPGMITDMIHRANYLKEQIQKPV